MERLRSPLFPPAFFYCIFVHLLHSAIRFSYSHSRTKPSKLPHSTTTHLAMSGTGVVSGAGLGVSGGKQRGVHTITSKAVLIGHECVPAHAVSQLSPPYGGHSSV